jgi:hypothetical protein
VTQRLWRQAAGLWGPAAFVAATLIGGARQPGYDHRRFHISGLAAHGTRSAPVMVAGFITLGIAGLVSPATRATRLLVRTAGVGTVLAGAFRCSDVRCPEPGRDPDATTADAIHAVASVVTFIVWDRIAVRGRPRFRIDARASRQHAPRPHHRNRVCRCGCNDTIG